MFIKFEFTGRTKEFNSRDEKLALMLVQHILKICSRVQLDEKKIRKNTPESDRARNVGVNGVGNVFIETPSSITSDE